MGKWLSPASRCVHHGNNPIRQPRSTSPETGNVLEKSSGTEMNKKFEYRPNEMLTKLNFFVLIRKNTY
jgi:hypothetical protein